MFNRLADVFQHQAELIVYHDNVLFVWQGGLQVRVFDVIAVRTSGERAEKVDSFVDALQEVDIITIEGEFGHDKYPTVGMAHSSIVKWLDDHKVEEEPIFPDFEDRDQTAAYNAAQDDLLHCEICNELFDNADHLDYHFSIRHM